MKKAFVILLSVLLLAACGDIKIHDDVNEGLAKDSLQAMEILVNATESDILSEDLAERDLMRLTGFQEKYRDRDNLHLFEVINETDEDIITFTLGSIALYFQSKLIESDKMRIKENREYIVEMIETGKPFLERND